MENNSSPAKTDRRVIKTKKAIRNAFAQLLSEKDVNKITIKDIADRADINRKTFYNYYSAVYQLIDEIEDDIVCKLEQTLTSIDFKKVVDNPYLILNNMTVVIDTDMDFFGFLMRINNNASLVSKIVTSCKNMAKKSLAEQLTLDPLKLDILVNYMISGMLAVYQQWFNSDRKQPIEELSGTLGLLAFRGISGLVAESK